jgi:hypothetical protein
MRVFTIAAHADGHCSTLDARGSGSGMGTSENLPIALARCPLLDSKERLALVYEAILTARRVGATVEEVSAVVDHAYVEADAEDARCEAGDGDEGDDEEDTISPEQDARDAEEQLEQMQTAESVLDGPTADEIAEFEASEGEDA